MDTTNPHRRSNFYCQVIIVLLALIALRVWLTPTQLLPQAQAQFMDSGAQRLRIVEEAQKTNALLTQISRTLAGTLRVELVDPEGAPGNSPRRPDNQP